MDFFTIKEMPLKNGTTLIYPDFTVGRSKDLMIRGKSFYAIWDEKRGLWSTDEYDVQRLVDEALFAHRREVENKIQGQLSLALMKDFSSNSWRNFRGFMTLMSDNAHQLDEKLTFANTEVKKQDYVSKRLPYSVEEGPTSAYDELMGTLYEPVEREKLEWAVGAIIAGDSKDIQKFQVLYGPPGAGKGTFINIIMRLFQGYYTTFEAKNLANGNSQFATEVFASNPLVAIQHDGELSKIDDNTRLNSIISHEEMTFNVKFKPSYTSNVNAFLFLGTNKPVKITDAKSGIIRRLIDVQPSGNRIPERHYHSLVAQIEFELGAIAAHCLKVYRALGKDYYSGYRPVEMILQTDVFYNFIEAYFDAFLLQDGTSLNQAYTMYKAYCDETLVDFKLPRHRFREELKNYFDRFEAITRVDGQQVRSYYSGFLKDKFNSTTEVKEPPANPLVIDLEESLLDTLLADYPAQYATENDTPANRWANVKTTLSDLDTTKVHYVKVPEHHIVIDFDLKDENGQKSAERNLEAASLFPLTYSEFSKGGGGLHLHYTYTGDPSELSRVYSEGIEVKVYTGDSSLRRKLSLCNNVPVAEISSGLPLKEKKVIDFDTMKSERSLINLIERNLRKEIHPGTKSSVDFIKKVLDDAYDSGMAYDVTPMRPDILQFAMSSSNQADVAIKLVRDMKFKSASEDTPRMQDPNYDEDRMVFFDVEVFPNLFVLSWKYEGSATVTSLINPTAQEIEPLLKMRLVGYNCRRYDNHIVYAAYMGYDNLALYELSQKIIMNSQSAYFSEAYNLSYTDIFDFASKKQSLKKWEIELGLKHNELGMPWDEPVPAELWSKVAEYCEDDVHATDAVFQARRQDFVARQILAELSGLTVNDTTAKHTARIVFGKDRTPQSQFIYTDLREDWPGYEYEFGKSTYKGEVVGEGGLVRAKPGMYSNVALLDIASMHPTTIGVLNLFGPYTKNFMDLVDARVAIKRKQYAEARQMLGGALTPFLTAEESAKDLAYALKIVINIVYGLTSASFENPFRDPRNIDNIVAKRGALFMMDLRDEVEQRGFSVIHIKTDSIKIPDATPEIIQFVEDFGGQHGYTFEHETTYDRMCLVNDAVYIAYDEQSQEWTATGAQFAHPFVFKKLFSRQEMEFDDLCETKQVTTALYLDFNEGLDEGEHDRRFIGKIGRFCPMLPGTGGGLLVREKDGEFHAATGTKGRRWMEAEVVRNTGKLDDIDMSYFRKLTDDAVENISQFGDFEWFTEGEPNERSPIRAIDQQD